jgi:heat shock protein 110kDa
VKDVKPSVTGEPQEVRVKVRINHNGLLLVSSATMLEKKDPNDAEQNGNEAEVPQQPPTEDQNSSQEQQNVSGEPMDTSGNAQTEVS